MLPHLRGLTTTHSDTPQSVGLLYTSDQPVAADLYLITHNTHKRQTYMPLAVFEPATPASQLAADPRLIPRGHRDPRIFGDNSGECTDNICSFISFRCFDTKPADVHFGPGRLAIW